MTTIDPINTHLVGSQGKDVVVVLPAALMTPADAMTHAAWLVTIAGALDPDLDFAEHLAAVQAT